MLVERLSWQERGVKERGGFAPSHKSLPLSLKIVFLY